MQVCLFAKPPVAGEVKTRLAATVGNDAAAQLARAFLLDTWEQITGLDWAQAIVATTGPLAAELGIAADRIWLQGDGDLGARITRILARGLTAHTASIAIGADTPGLPVDLLEAAHRELENGNDAVIGPTDDGGFYLLGLRRCPENLLADLPWSTEETFAATRARLDACGLRTIELPRWFDVDRPADLVRLEAELAAGRIHAPHTVELLARIGQSDRQSTR